jgi:hypothetical protein
VPTKLLAWLTILLDQPTLSSFSRRARLPLAATQPIVVHIPLVVVGILLLAKPAVVADTRLPAIHTFLVRDQLTIQTNRRNHRRRPPELSKDCLIAHTQILRHPNRHHTRRSVRRDTRRTRFTQRLRHIPPLAIHPRRSHHHTHHHYPTHRPNRPFASRA